MDRSITGLQSTTSNGNNSTPRMAHPELRTTKEDDNVDFSFLRRQLFTSDQAEALEREILLRSVRSAQNVT